MLKGILGFVAFIVLVIFIVVIVARGGDNNSSTNAPVPQLSAAASSDATFVYMEDGPIVAEEDHFRITISVSRWNRTINVYQGYENNVVSTASFGNNEAAFSDFLSAIDRAGYTSKRATRYDSEAGLCALNSRFRFESDQFGEDFSRWTTLCREKGNFGGNFSNTRTLYRDQIPEYSDFISNTRRSTGLSI